MSEHERLNDFIRYLKEALQPQGGCQCGCSGAVLGAVEEAADKLALMDSARDTED